jgi:hypothetical protein
LAENRESPSTYVDLSLIEEAERCIDGDHPVAFPCRQGITNVHAPENHPLDGRNLS